MTTVATPAARAWEAERGRLIGIAYRMLGDFGHAEDVVSEVAIDALRTEQADAGGVRSWPAWLTTTCVRRSIDRVRSLAAVREDYTGHWLPEPVETSRLPEDAVADREMLSLALLHLAEQLTPDARAAVVLHRAYGMPATEIAEILEKSPAAVRQLISRGERRLRLDEDASPPRATDPQALSALVDEGLVTRSSDPADGRAVIVALTEAGEAAYRSYREATDDIISETFARWSAADLDQLARYLERVARDFAAGS